ncbi:MAG: hypothetical protein ACD_63C00024G0006 [uncultured bacterium]|nr:MAG: hypothetical protein ACD_63C00024G0006 [uncultured bacterium]
MPDLITHTAFAYFFTGKTRRFVIFVLLGAVLPDLTRVAFVIFTKNPHAYYFFAPLHTPFGSLLFVFLVVLLFEKEIRFRAFLWMLLGVAIHLILDVFQGHYTSYPYQWAFPYLGLKEEIFWFWPENTIYVAPFVLLAAILFYFYKKSRIKN